MAQKPERQHFVSKIPVRSDSSVGSKATFSRVKALKSLIEDNEGTSAISIKVCIKTTTSPPELMHL